MEVKFTSQLVNHYEVIAEHGVETISCHLTDLEYVKSKIIMYKKLGYDNVRVNCIMDIGYKIVDDNSEV